MLRIGVVSNCAFCPLFPLESFVAKKEHDTFCPFFFDPPKKKKTVELLSSTLCYRFVGIILLGFRESNCQFQETKIITLENRLVATLISINLKPPKTQQSSCPKKGWYTMFFLISFILIWIFSSVFLVVLGCPLNVVQEESERSEINSEAAGRKNSEMPSSKMVVATIPSRQIISRPNWPVGLTLNGGGLVVRECPPKLSKNSV